MIELNNKNILIVGASSGIGEKTAHVLAEQGANVFLVARREERLKKICDSINAPRKGYYVADISELDKIGQLVKTIVAEQGRIDGLAYVAGIVDDVPLKLLTYDRHIHTFQTNYFAFVEVVRQVTKRGNYNEGLRIAAVSSVASLCGEKGHTAYSASKAAMDSAIRCMAKEFGPRKICINSVAPSMVKTYLYERFLELCGAESKANTSLFDRQYLGLAEPEDVAYAIAFLLSKEARFITGITLPVDGGFSTT